MSRRVQSELMSTSYHTDPVTVHHAQPACPGVTMVVPCRNERDHIEDCVRSLLSQEPPESGYELLIVDGMSDDGTREILRRLEAEDPRLRVIDNPDRITPSAMNAGIRMARGRYIAILGAHATYAVDYIRTCADILDLQPEVWCSGGPIVSRARGAFGRAVAAAMSHPAGVGNAKHRFPEYGGHAEGACFPMFRRETFERVGMYDECLVRNQDDELNLRVARAGGKVFISPRARCEYYVRETVPGLFRQYYQYGYWRVAVLRKHRIPASWRQMAPVAFFGLILAGLGAGFWLSGTSGLIVAVTIPAVYVFLLLASGLCLVARAGAGAGLLFPLAAGIMHLAYATGFVAGFVTGKRDRAMSNEGGLNES